MEPRTLLDILTVAERLKDTTRHCYTSGGRRESVAEHSWMMTLMSFLLRSEFPDADMDKVTRMCIIHDLGECFTGDIPTFDKTAAHEAKEEDLLTAWVHTLPQPQRDEMTALYAEMNALQTQEASTKWKPSSSTTSPISPPGSPTNTSSTRPTAPTRPPSPLTSPSFAGS